MSSADQHREGRSGRFPVWAIVLLAILGAVILVGAGVLGGLTLRGAGSATGRALSGLTSGDSRSVCDAEKVAEDVLPSIVTIGVQAGDGSGGTGSGEIITADGYILTNNHVIAPAAEGADIVVLYNDGSTHPAKLVGRSPRADIAVVKVQGSGLPVIKQGDSASLKVARRAG